MNSCLYIHSFLISVYFHITRFLMDLCPHMFPSRESTVYSVISRVTKLHSKGPPKTFSHRTPASSFALTLLIFPTLYFALNVAHYWFIQSLVLSLTKLE